MEENKKKIRREDSKRRLQTFGFSQYSKAPVRTSYYLYTLKCTLCFTFRFVFFVCLILLCFGFVVVFFLCLILFSLKHFLLEPESPWSLSHHSTLQHLIQNRNTFCTGPLQRRVNCHFHKVHSGWLKHLGKQTVSLALLLKHEFGICCF